MLHPPPGALNPRVRPDLVGEMVRIGQQMDALMKVTNKLPAAIVHPIDVTPDASHSACSACVLPRPLTSRATVPFFLETSAVPQDRDLEHMFRQRVQRAASGPVPPGPASEDDPAYFPHTRVRAAAQARRARCCSPHLACDRCAADTAVQ